MATRLKAGSSAFGNIYIYIILYNGIIQRIMALSIKSLEAERLARLVAKQTGESLTDAIEQALRERLERLRRKQNAQVLTEKLRDIARRVSALPILDSRTADEIIGYDENGVPR